MGNKRAADKTHEIIEKDVFTFMEWQETLTILDLNNKGIADFDENVVLPQNLVELNLAKNMLREVPLTVLKLDKLKTLNLSDNDIELFDDTPNFCHTIESLNVSNNKLISLPYWIWAESPKNLIQLNLSHNSKLCQSLEDNYYFQEMLRYQILVKRIDIYHCSLRHHMKLVSMFRHAKVLNIGYNDDNNNYRSINHIENLPCIGLDECHEIEVLNVCNTHIYSIQHNIDMYQYLIEINLSYNNINSLPNEFCNLVTLETCILSFNKILYLPEEMDKLQKLTRLYLDNNELCMLPDTLNRINCLRILDLYNNHLYEGFKDFKQLYQYDFAQNYSEEPNDEDYLKKRGMLRQHCSGRLNGRAAEDVHDEYSKSEEEFDDFDIKNENDAPEVQESASRCSSPEDWDSDDYWVPAVYNIPQKTAQALYRNHSTTRTPAMQWINYVKKKMAEGNFCPMDMHLTVSITEQVKYEKMYYPNIPNIIDGQFDDYSDDDT